MSYLSLNGEILPEIEARIPATDRGFLFGDGTFTTLKVSSGVAQDLHLHLQRLEDACRVLNIAYPGIEPQEVTDLIEAQGAQDGVWRLKILISAADPGYLDLRPRTAGTVLMSLKPYREPAGPLKIGYCPHPGLGIKVKSLAYLNRLQLKDEARRRGLDDVITIDQNGYILQASAANVFWVKGRELWTPSPDLDLLYGITIRQQVERYRSECYTIHHGCYRPEALPNAAKFFLCNALMGAIEADHSDMIGIKSSCDFPDQVLADNADF